MGTPGPGPTTCTASTVTSPSVAPSPSATGTWEPGTGPGLTPSRSSERRLWRPARPDSSGEADARQQDQVPSRLQGPEARRSSDQGQQARNLLRVNPCNTETRLDLV